MVMGVITAMPSELKGIVATMDKVEVKDIAGYIFNINNIEGNIIVGVCCGVGKVNAAVCTQVLIDTFKPNYIINSGTAGGTGEGVSLCDLVISTDLMHHDLLPRLLMKYPPYHNTFEADTKLIKLAEDVCAELCYTAHKGRIVSGEQFFTTMELRNRVINEFAPYAVDMESAAIAHCAYRNSQPFVAIRCISDKADTESEATYLKYVETAADRAARVTMGIINKLIC